MCQMSYLLNFNLLCSVPEIYRPTPIEHKDIVDIMMLYISAMDHAMKLKFSSYVYLPSTNETFQYRYLD